MYVSKSLDYKRLEEAILGGFVIDDRGPVIPLDRDTTFIFDWKGFTANLIESVSGFVLKGWADGGVSGIASLAKALMSGSLEEPPSARAWRLIALCFAWSLDDLKGRETLDTDQLRAALRVALDQAKEEIDAGQEVLSLGFLENPPSSLIYQLMRETVVNRRVEIALRPHLNDIDLRAKLDNSFTLAVLDVWSSNPAFYASLVESLETPVNEAAQRTLDWRRYRQQVLHDFEVTTTFGQENSGVSLSQIYVPLRGYWEEEIAEGRKGRNEDGRLPKNARGMWLDKSLDKWLAETDPKDWLRLIGGGPGSGKSTTLRAFTARTAQRDGWRPLFIPLQHIGINGDLRAAINKYFVDTTGSAFTHDPLSRVSIETGVPLVLVFDGLDELVAPNEKAKETVSVFVHKLNSLVNDLRGETQSLLKVVVSGRMLAFQAAKNLLTIPNDGAIEVYGYLPASQSGLIKADDIWNIDQRPLWWDRYAQALSLDRTLPQAFQARELDSITHEPLLSYLLVLAGFSSHNWERAAENPNRIYATLMSDIYTRGWGDSAIRARSMTSNDFNSLMQTIGLAAWLGGDSRVASEESFLKTLQVTRSTDAWRAFNEDHGSDVTNLAMNFYLKSSDRFGRGFEFTHKSFGEYLAALAILDVAFVIQDTLANRPEYALQDWFAATGSGYLTTEVLEFLRREVRLRWQEGGEEIRARLRQLKEVFEGLAQSVMVGGFPVSNSGSWRSTEIRQLNAEAAVWAMLNAVVRAIIATDGSDGVVVEVPALQQGGMRTLQMRHAAVGGYSTVVQSCMTALKAQFLSVGGVQGTGLDLAHADIEVLVVEGSIAYFGSLERARVGNLNLHNCLVLSWDFRGIIVESMMLTGSSLHDCNFENSQISRLRVDEESVLLSKDMAQLMECSDRTSIFYRDDEARTFDDVVDRAKTLIDRMEIESPESRNEDDSD